MNIDNRTSEILNNLKSASKETYHKNEILSELFSLQQEMVNLTFNSNHAKNSNLRIWDVEQHLTKMNDDCDNIASKELADFKTECFCFSNLIKAECSGKKGEYKAFSSLEKIQGEHLILKNVELSNGNYHTEIDAIAITHKGIFIIEVKNTHRDIFIDEKGGYYRTGKYLHWDSNLGKKLETKKELLKKTLSSIDFDKLNIFELVVFTNNRIEVQNCCTSIVTCFLEQLPHLVNSWTSESFITTEDMHKIYNTVDQASSLEKYPLEFDVNKFKKDFACLLAKLELYKQSEIETDYSQTKKSQPDHIQTLENTIFSSKSIKTAGVVLLASLVIAATISNLKIKWKEV